jgi:hypothetical protein
VLSGAGAIGVAFALPKSSNDAPIASPKNLILVIGSFSFVLDTILINTRPSPDRFDADQKCRLLISGSERCHHITKAPAFEAGVFGTQTIRALGGVSGDGGRPAHRHFGSGDYSESV